MRSHCERDSQCARLMLIKNIALISGFKKMAHVPFGWIFRENWSNPKQKEDIFWDWLISNPNTGGVVLFCLGCVAFEKFHLCLFYKKNMKQRLLKNLPILLDQSHLQLSEFNKSVSLTVNLKSVILTDSWGLILIHMQKSSKDAQHFDEEKHTSNSALPFLKSAST